MTPCFLFLVFSAFVFVFVFIPPCLFTSHRGFDGWARLEVSTLYPPTISIAITIFCAVSLDVRRVYVTFCLC